MLTHAPGCRVVEGRRIARVVTATHLLRLIANGLFATTLLLATLVHLVAMAAVPASAAPVDPDGPAAVYLERVLPGEVFSAAPVFADFNADGRIDAAFVGDELVVMLRAEDRTLREAYRAALERPPARVTVADIDGDGHVDLVGLIGLDGWSGIAALPGAGDGTFAPAIHSPVAGHAGGLTLGDFDGDGILDAATTSSSTAALVLYGEGDGRFGSMILARGAAIPGSVAAADVDGDGIDDLLTGDRYGLNVHLGRAARGFQAIALKPRPSGSGLTTRDFDGDGVVDLWAGGTAHRGLGDGQFELLESYGVSGRPIVEDFDRDGELDLLFSSRSAASLLLGDGDGTFTAGPAPALPGTAICAGDLDADDTLDLGVAGTGGMIVVSGSGDGSFPTNVRLAVGRRPQVVASGHLDGDGHSDLVVARSGATHVNVFLGLGDGSFSRAGAADVSGGPLDIVIADFDSDGSNDLATVSAGTRDAISVLAGAGDGSFELVGIHAAGDDPRSIVAGHFDDDAALDLAVANRGSGDVSMLHGDGDGGFGPERAVVAGLEPFALAASDLDGDGRDDLAVANFESNDVSILLADGEGGFAYLPPVAAPEGPVAIAAGDLDADGTADLVTAARDEAWLMTGAGDGSFEASTRFETGSYSRPIAVGYIDGGRDADVVFVDRASWTVSVVFGDGAGGTVARHDYVAGRSPSSLAIDDFDGDGWYDLVVTNRNDHDATILINQSTGCPPGDDVAPSVTILVTDDTIVSRGAMLPVSEIFAADDEDGYEEGVARERILIGDCAVLDGAVDGDGDGLLSDESMPLDVERICEAAARCGVDVLAHAAITVEAQDCNGTTATADIALDGRLATRRACAAWRYGSVAKRR